MMSFSRKSLTEKFEEKEGGGLRLFTRLFKNPGVTSTSTVTKSACVDKNGTPSCMFEVYSPFFKVLQFVGSSCFKVRRVYPTTAAEMKTKTDEESGQGLGQIERDGKTTFGSDTQNHNGRDTWSIYFKTSGRYYVGKLLCLAQLIFFLVRFYNLAVCKDSPYCRAKGAYLLTLGAYIEAVCMILIIFFWSHWKNKDICEFFTQFNDLDRLVFDEKTAKDDFIKRHRKIFQRVKIYVPIVSSASLILMGVNHANHPQFMSHITSVLFKDGDTFTNSYRNIIITVASFSSEFFLIIYVYLGTYQFLFLSIVVARAFTWIMESLISQSSPEKIVGMLRQNNNKGNSLLFQHVQNVTEKFEIVRDRMMHYNRLYSGLHLLCKGMLLFQITVTAYFPLQNMNKVPFSSLQIFLTVMIHSTVQIVLQLTEMGNVHKETSQFREVWIQNLEKASRVMNAKYGNEHIEAMEMIRLKAMLESCTPFGFNFGGCYVVTSNTILTVFSILSTYLIIMLQLRI